MEPVSKRRRLDPEQRRSDILSAALLQFAQNGFAATRIEDVAARAGIAKGTVYLHFPDKETLFTELVSSIASPILVRLGDMAARHPEEKARRLVGRIYTMLREEVLETDRRHLLHLIIAEGPRFPKITEHYFRMVIEPGLATLTQVLKRAAERGELRNPAVLQAPQLIMAPIIMTLIWRSLFDTYRQLDAQNLFETFLDTVFHAAEGDVR